MSKEYDVGYGKPPKSNQFKPGASGNPAGRPKGVKNLSTYLISELTEKLHVTEGGKQILITKFQAMIKSMVAMALKGDARARNEVLKLIRAHEENISGTINSGGTCSMCQCASKDQAAQFDLDKVLEGLGGQNESPKDG